MSYDSLDKQAAGPSGPEGSRLRSVDAGGIDARMQGGAYVTDGINLYEIIGVRRGPGMMGVSTVRVEIENCRTFTRIELLPDKIKRSFSLVRPAPVGVCPDLVADIAWH